MGRISVALTRPAKRRVDRTAATVTKVSSRMRISCRAQVEPQLGLSHRLNLKYVPACLRLGLGCNLYWIIVSCMPTMVSDIE